jgi:hypothetical protein
MPSRFAARQYNDRQAAIVADAKKRRWLTNEEGKLEQPPPVAPY